MLATESDTPGFEGDFGKCMNHTRDGYNTRNSMSLLKQWFLQPRQVWLRRAVFQVHLWIGLTLGLYIVMLSVSGSVLVYRRELVDMLDTPTPEFQPERPTLSEAEIKRAAEIAHPDFQVTQVGTRVTERLPAMSVRLESGDTMIVRLFNPYTGEDLGDSFPAGVEAVDHLARLHDNLLMGINGRWANGVGSTLVTLLILTGAIVWWPGRKRWRQSMSVKWRASWTRINWDLHSAMGFWVFALLLLWAVSGIYLAFPAPFTAAVEYLSFSDTTPGERVGDTILDWLTRLHFGRFRTQPAIQALWAVLGLVPAALGITGAVMWWNRVLRKVPGGGRDILVEAESREP